MSKSRLICAAQQITVKRIDYGFPSHTPAIHPPTLNHRHCRLPPTTNEMSCCLYNRILLAAGYVMPESTDRRSRYIATYIRHRTTIHHLHPVLCVFPLSSPTSFAFLCRRFHSVYTPQYGNTLRDRVNVYFLRYFIFPGSAQR